MRIFNNYSICHVQKSYDIKTNQKKQHFFNKLKRVINKTFNFYHKDKQEIKTNNKKILREHLVNSYVVPDSYVTAKGNFLNTERFNGIKKEVTAKQQRQLTREKHCVMKGSVLSLIDKGIISGNNYQNELPILCDYARVDKNTNILIPGMSTRTEGLMAYNGNDVIAAEIIPGTPLGNYYNQQNYDADLQIIQLNNGNCGTIACKFDTTQVVPEKPLLIHCGELSGCTVVYAKKGNEFFAFHTGKPGNNNDSWETATDGAKTIIDSHQKLIGKSSAYEQVNNAMLANYLAEHFDVALMTFCGHGEKIASKKNVSCFDYNKPSALTNNDKARVANSMALLINKQGVCQVKAISDDLIIDKKSLAISSLANIISRF